MAKAFPIYSISIRLKKQTLLSKIYGGLGMLHKPDRTGTLDQREEGRDLTARRTTGTGSAQDQTLPTGRQCDSCSYMREGMIRITEGWISQDGHASCSHCR